jgi:hypothetical protein
MNAIVLALGQCSHILGLLKKMKMKEMRLLFSAECGSNILNSCFNIENSYLGNIPVTHIISLLKIPMNPHTLVILPQMPKGQEHVCVVEATAAVVK